MLMRPLKSIVLGQTASFVLIAVRTVPAVLLLCWLSCVGGYPGVVYAWGRRSGPSGPNERITKSRVLTDPLRNEDDSM